MGRTFNTDEGGKLHNSDADRGLNNGPQYRKLIVREHCTFKLLELGKVLKHGMKEPFTVWLMRSGGPVYCEGRETE